MRGQKVRPDARYSAVFVTTQAVPEKFGRNRQRLDIRAVEAMKRYLKESGPVSAELQGTVVAI